MSFNCEIVTDSLSPQGCRLTTMKLTFPRFILAEFNTHRMFSRNSASSRAIPFNKMVKMVEDNPFIPIAWQRDHKGMQGTEYLSLNDKTFGYFVSDGKIVSREGNVQESWELAKTYAIKAAIQLHKQSVTKQLCNRLLEPFMWHTVIVTATEWENFFKLRCPQYQFLLDIGQTKYRSKKDVIKQQSALGNDEPSTLTDLQWLQMNQSQAEIHIQAIAELMWDAYNESTPKQLQAGEWYIPFGDNIDYKRVGYTEDGLDYVIHNDEKDLVKIATARCARISYQTLGDNPKIDYEADIKLHDVLVSNGHASPLEHVARAMNQDEFTSRLYKSNGESGWCRNFRGFIQYRHLVETL